ncbi:hypothetical protein ACVME8_007248 [Bradyrhizobium diazoefficiens]
MKSASVVDDACWPISSGASCFPSICIKKGGHVAALHAHLHNHFFFKIDIQNFYYSIARMRVTRALRQWGYPGANTFAMWSCVRNPLPGPKHALPIGFVQSPLLELAPQIRTVA